jgi:IS30 family transposase
MDREQQYAQQEALLGEVEKQMRTEVLQLCGRKQSGAVSKALCTAADKMNLQELLHFKQELLTEQHGTPEVQLLCEDMGTMDAFCC